MIEFSTMLKHYMNTKDVTIHELSSSSGIDRSTLYKIANGTRKPSGPEIVERIADSLRLNQNERFDLRGAYYLTTLGPVHYYGGQQVTELMNHLTGQKTIPLPLPSGISSELSVPSDAKYLVLENSDDLLHAMFCSMADAGNTKNREVRLFTSDLTPTLVSLLTFLCRMHPDVKVTHLIVCDNTKTISEDSRLHNLDVMSKSLPLISNYPNYHVRCIYADISTTRSFSPLMSEMFLTDHYSLVYSRNLDHAILSSDPEILALRRDIFNQLNDAACDSFLYLPPEQFFTNARNTIRSGNAKDRRYLLNPGLCSVMLLNPDEDAEDIAKFLHFRDSRMNEIFIRNFSEYLPDQKAFLINPDASFVHLTTRQGIEYFANTGYLNEISPSVTNPLPYKSRLKYLKRWRSLYEDGAFLLLDVPTLRSDSSICLLSTPQSLNLQVSAENGQFLTEQVQEPGITSLFFWYCKFLSKDCLMSRQEALSCFDRSIRFLENAAG